MSKPLLQMHIEQSDHLSILMAVELALPNCTVWHLEGSLVSAQLQCHVKVDR